MLEERKVGAVSKRLKNPKIWDRERERERTERR